MPVRQPVSLLRLPLIAVLLYGCGGDSTTAPPPPPPPPGAIPVASVVVEPGSHGLVTGETTTLTATPRDAQGNPLTGRTLAWSANPASVASVSTSGVVTGITPGSATVTATSEGASGTATITVQDGGVAPPSGGTIASADGRVVLTVPAGATSIGIAITVAPVAAPPAAPTLIPGTAYELGPAGSVFAQPVMIRLSYQASQLPAGTNVERLRVHRWSGTAWELLPNGSVNTAAQTVQGETIQFSIFAILEEPYPVPVLTALEPAAVVVGSAGFLLTATGTDFVAGSALHWAGEPLATTVVSATTLTAPIPASALTAIGNVPVAVVTPAPGGGTSDALSFTVAAPVPAITTLSPSSAVAGDDALALTVTGIGFSPGAQVRWNGISRTTTVVSATELTATIPVTDLATPGSAEVTVFVPAPGGGTSAPATFTILAPNPVPTLTSVAPPSAVAGTPGLTLSATGADFLAGAQLHWNGAPRTTTVTSATALTAVIPASDLAAAGEVELTVVNPAPGGGASTPLAFSILAPQPAPTLSGFDPEYAIATGPAFTLTVTGTGFVASTVLRWNGVPRPTTIHSATSLSAEISDEDIAAPGTAFLTLVTPAPGGGTTSSFPFTIHPPYPAPTLSGLSPGGAVVGAAGVVVTITGTDFVPGATARWNGANRPTTFVSATEVTAVVAAGDLMAGGTASVSVANPAPGGGVSAPLDFLIVPTALDVTALDDLDDGACTPAHCSLREALTAANLTGGPHTISLGAGTITLTDTLPTITSSVTITGAGANLTIIDANADVDNRRRVFSIEDQAEVSLTAFTVTGGYAPLELGASGQGGGIRVIGEASLRLEDITVTGNRGRFGSGVDARSTGRIEIVRSRLSGNTLGTDLPATTGFQNHGGGLRVGSEADEVVIRDSEISNNIGLPGYGSALGTGAFISGSTSAVRVLENVTVDGNEGTSAGAGLYLGGPGAFSLDQMIITGNYTPGNGGGMAVTAGPAVTITNSTIAGNTAVGPGSLNGGGGIWNNPSGLAEAHLILTNVTVSGNRSTHGAGLSLNGRATLTNVTVIGNRIEGAAASQQGAGLRIGTGATIHVTLSSILLTDNLREGVPQNCWVSSPSANPPQLLSGGHNLSDDSTCTPFFDPVGLNDLPDTPAGIDPALADNGGPTWTHALLAGSAAIDAGNPATCPAADQRGAPRVGTCDIGAFEFGGTPPAALMSAVRRILQPRAAPRR